ncbi:hypothetical protein SAY87_006319 [Trapa incisa]|uniref:Auxin efflux carrier component n=1 Tax=Trapa incisa TaxID=236973 RepID=A0AAN7JZL4_9MYRT|nr:hypothetical protein SAY87_006319 [Trapa incisa]
MITLQDFYNVMCAMVPLYFAMFVAYGSVKWWKIFTPEQCSGINRFVAVFAVPVLSFHFISQNDPYQMDSRFILADTVSKVLVLVVLSVWAAAVSSRGGARLDWVITMFSVATLPNTLVMGIPLLKAMYGDFTQSLMVQVVVFQCIIWYTLLLFLFEYRAATQLIRNQFPGPTAASISKFEIDGDVISLDGRDPICTESEVDGSGGIRVRIRRSTSSAPDSALSSTVILTPRASNLSGAEIFSVNTPAHNTALSYCGDHNNGVTFARASPRLSGYGSSDAYSLQPTPPRASNFNEMDDATATMASLNNNGGTPDWIRSPPMANSPIYSGVKMVWESPFMGDDDVARKGINVPGKEISFRENVRMPEQADSREADQQMPGALVMLRLILTVVGRKLSRNPNTYSSILGLLWSLISFKWDVGMPSLLKNSIKIISDAGLGMAMFSLGLFMALQPRIIACGGKMAAISMSIRFFCGPLVVSAASIAVRLKGARLHAAIVQAALPQGIVPFVFAREYGVHPDILSTG